MPIFGSTSHTQMISLQGQHCVHCALMDSLCLLAVHSFSGSSAFASKGLNVPHVSSRNMTERDCIRMTKMNELNGSYLSLSYFCVSQQVQQNSNRLPVQMGMVRSEQAHWEILLSPECLRAGRCCCKYSGCSRARGYGAYFPVQEEIASRMILCSQVPNAGTGKVKNRWLCIRVSLLLFHIRILWQAWAGFVPRWIL